MILDAATQMGSNFKVNISLGTRPEGVLELQPSFTVSDDGLTRYLVEEGKVPLLDSGCDWLVLVSHSFEGSRLGRVVSVGNLNCALRLPNPGTRGMASSSLLWGIEVASVTPSGVEKRRVY